MTESTVSRLPTRGEQMLALRRRRMAGSPAFLRGGFRPFFFCAALWAALAIALWVASLDGRELLPNDLDPLAWHRHEMLFGFVGSAVAGFLLTAIPNWTGRLPIAGPPLAGLVALWVSARIAMLFSAVVGLPVTAALDVGFFLVLAGLAGREVIAANNRNLPVVGLLLLFGFADAGDYAGAAGWIGDSALPAHAAIALVTIMISVIGGRIIPSFTRNWLSKQGRTKGLPTQPGRFDLVAIALTALALLFWLGVPEGLVTAGLLAIAAAGQAARLLRWRGYRTLRDPLLFILHIAYAWIPAGLLLLALSAAGAPVQPSAAIHALTAGAMGTMILAVMSRASLGHTGRSLKASPPTVVAYALVTAGALVRVAAPYLPCPYLTAVTVAGALWGGAMLLFAIAYAPVLWGPRIGEDGGRTRART